MNLDKETFPPVIVSPWLREFGIIHNYYTLRGLVSNPLKLVPNAPAVGCGLVLHAAHESWDTK